VPVSISSRLDARFRGAAFLEVDFLPADLVADDLFADDFFADDFFADDLFADDLFADDLFAADFLADDFFADDFFAEDFLADDFLPAAPVFAMTLLMIEPATPKLRARGRTFLGCRVSRDQDADFQRASGRLVVHSPRLRRPSERWCPERAQAGRALMAAGDTCEWGRVDYNESWEKRPGSCSSCSPR
jgi:hypothetical protein